MKAKRQRKILELIDKYDIETQDELVTALRKEGFEVTQATVSRDIKELGLVKIPAGNNAYHYGRPQEQRGTNYERRLRRMFRDSVVSIDHSENLILVRTLPGTANAVASCIDNVVWEEVIGTVAGDDTILVIVKPKEAVPAVLERMNNLLA
ncbi:MAG: arginine repressor [Thermoanaerobacteraceae bacterium]|nr:arginine repressor [Thermoanaerobacteraceae bacterium]